jgi:molybdate transport system ATP-binding protein
MTAPPAHDLMAHFEGRRGDFWLDASFEMPLRGVTSLFGPSGSGKTTILRALAGLDRLEGDLFVGGETWQDPDTFRPAHKRPIGYVFQEASLFAHLDVRHNLLFGLRRVIKGVGAAHIDPDSVIELLKLDPLLSRMPHTLSGGERQRAAIGRALLSQPRLILLDEPLTGLDSTAKDEILSLFEILHEALDIPMLFVSHEIAEVERIADHMIVIGDGQVIAAGPLNDVLTSPALTLRDSRTAASVLAARVDGYDPADRLSSVELSGQILWIAGFAGEPGIRLRVRIAARDVSLAIEPPSRTTILNTLLARIAAIDWLDEAEANIVLALGREGNGPTIIARVTRRSVRNLDLAPGMSVYAQLKSVSLATGPGTP